MVARPSRLWRYGPFIGLGLLLSGLAADGDAQGLARPQGAVLDHQVAVLQGLDKITARVSPVFGTLGLPTYFGSLEIVVRACRETPPTEPPESAAFVEIRELPPNADRDREPEILFSGWMFASSPAVSALEHAVYDIWVVDCEEPITSSLDAQGVLDSIAPPSE
jgi:hypothetical protein